VIGTPMLLAEHQGELVDPYPTGRAACPVCRTPVIGKCGHLITWHWAHEHLQDCDPWAEPDTEWHRQWEAEVPRANREVIIGCHRADIRTDQGVVVELQHSPISTEEIREREQFYGQRMLWVFDAVEAFHDGRLLPREQKYGLSFRWMHPRKSVGACRRPVLLDLGDQLIRLRKIDTAAPCGGWGVAVSRASVVASMLQDRIPMPCASPSCLEMSARPDSLCPRHAPADQPALLW
jgi:competence protein CoiA